MLSAQVQASARRAAEIVVRPLAVIGISPNAVTVVGLALNVGVAFVLASGALQIGGVLLLLAGGFDMLDGALARLTKRFSTFGAFLDSVLDRYSEAIIAGGLLYNRMQHHDQIAVMLLYALLVGSFMVSYTRARAEGLGLTCKGGLVPRPERIVLLALGLLFALLTPVLIILVVLTQITTLQRMLHVWRIAREHQGPMTDRGSRIRAPDERESYS